MQWMTIYKRWVISSLPGTKISLRQLSLHPHRINSFERLYCMFESKISCFCSLKFAGEHHLREWKTCLQTVICYFALQGFSPKEVHKDMVATYGESAPSYSMVKKWATQFQCGRESLEDDSCPGKSDNIINKIHNKILWDWQITQRHTAKYFTRNQTYKYPRSSPNDKGVSLLDHKTSWGWSAVGTSRNNLALFYTDSQILTLISTCNWGLKNKC